MIEGNDGEPLDTEDSYYTDNGLLSFWAILRHVSFNPMSEIENSQARLTHCNPVAQGQRDTLCFAPDPNMPCDGACLGSLHTQIR